MMKKRIPKGPLAKKIIAEVCQHKNSKISDLSAWKEAKSLQEEIEAASKKRDNESFEPLHRVYVEQQNRLSVFAELLSTVPFVSPLNEIVEKAEDIYMPSYPPMSPITNSVFGYWTLFDVCVGDERESYASLIIHLLRECKGIEPSFLELLEAMYDSRLGLYRHEGQDDKFVYLKEFGTNETFKAYSTSGYLGKRGEIWLARILPSDPWGLTDYRIVVTTPYTIINSPKNSLPLKYNDVFYDDKIWIDYIERSVGQLDTASGYAKLMKYGMPSDPYYWLEYIFLAYVNHTDQQIILTGLPDQPHTLPHHPDAKYFNKQHGAMPASPNDLSLTQPLADLLPKNQDQYSGKLTKKVNVGRKEKISRNAPCPCGSGKKYKKCCAQTASESSSNKIVPFQDVKPGNESGRILMTTTQECIMPVRLCYQVKNSQILVNQLGSLRCLEWKEKVGEKFFINYCDESSAMALKVAADEVPKEAFPIVLTHGKIVKDQMILDVRSWLRGVELVKFIDHYIDRSAAEITHVILWNKIHYHTSEIYEKLFQHDYDELFALNKVEMFDADVKKINAYMKAHEQDANSMQEKIYLIDQYMEKNNKFREFEKLPFSLKEEEDIEWLKNVLTMREVVAFKRFSGNKNFTLYQLMQEMAQAAKGIEN